jgi:hypothetical protein
MNGSRKDDTGQSNDRGRFLVRAAFVLILGLTATAPGTSPALAVGGDCGSAYDNCGHFYAMEGNCDDRNVFTCVNGATCPTEPHDVLDECLGEINLSGCAHEWFKGCCQVDELLGCSEELCGVAQHKIQCDFYNFDPH